MNLFFVRQLRESAKTSLWILPGTAAATAVLLAKTLPILEAAVPHGDSAWYLFPGQPDSARELLSTIASAMMTFTGLVFSITILVLQLASSQFSPRVLHAFLSDRSTRLAMASFVGTFVYSLALLPEVRGSDAAGGERVPAFSVFIAFVLVLVSVGVFVRYIHRMAHSIRAVDVLRRVAEEATKCLDVLYPESPDGELPKAMTFARPCAEPGQIVSNRRSGGVLAAVDEEALVDAARECGAIIEVVPSLGDFVVRGGPLLRVWCSARVDPERMAAHVVIADERTAQQDPAFAFRQLVDIAIRALSPGTNDPTTAVQAINRIHDLLTALANRSFPATSSSTTRASPGSSSRGRTGTSSCISRSTRSVTMAVSRCRSCAGSARRSKTSAKSVRPHGGASSSSSDVRSTKRPDASRRRATEPARRSPAPKVRATHRPMVRGRARCASAGSSARATAILAPPATLLVGVSGPRLRPRSGRGRA